MTQCKGYPSKKLDISILYVFEIRYDLGAGNSNDLSTHFEKWYVHNGKFSIFSQKNEVLEPLIDDPWHYICKLNIQWLYYFIFVS